MPTTTTHTKREHLAYLAGMLARAEADCRIAFARYPSDTTGTGYLSGRLDALATAYVFALTGDPDDRLGLDAALRDQLMSEDDDTLADCIILGNPAGLSRRLTGAVRRRQLRTA